MNKANIEVFSPSLPNMRDLAKAAAEKALGVGVTYWLTPLAPATTHGRTLMGEPIEWYQEWEIMWAESEDDLLDD
jgi:hypothetical protein